MLKRIAAVCLVLVGSVGIQGSATGQAQSQSALSAQDGLRLMRMVMSVEASMKKTGFGTLEQVLGDRMFTQSPVSIVVTSPGTASVLDYQLRVTRPDDGGRFEASLTPMSGCSTAWFGTERNLIYTGRALGCPGQ